MSMKQSAEYNTIGNGRICGFQTNERQVKAADG